MRASLLLAAFLVAACAGRAPWEAGPEPAFPPTGAGLPAGGTAFSSASLARVFVALTHDLEWGAARPGLVRMEAPVAVTLDGPGSGQYAGFLDRHLGVLRDGAGVAIAPGGAARSTIRVRFIDGESFARALPSAACVVAPGEPGWSEFRRAPSSLGGDAFAAITTLDAATIFVPASAPPHVIRGCLIEEIAQALGPANDLYGLGPSIFNDDAAHVWPTALDLLMLRVLYAPEIASGMDRAATEAAARAALDRLNPAGRAAPDLLLVPDAALGEWRQIAQRVFARGMDAGRREDRARAAARLAASAAPGSPQECQSAAALARVIAEARPDEGAARFAEARALCIRVHGAGDIRAARLALEEGVALQRSGEPRRALAVTDGLAPAFADLAQEERLATLFALRARALRAIQQGERSFEARRLAAEWGAYAFGADSAALERWLGP